MTTNHTVADRDRGGIDKGEEKRYFEVAEDVRDKASTIIRENIIIRKEFDEIRASLEGEIVRLRSENELIMKEYERMYEQNRETEARIARLQEDYKQFVMEGSTQKRKQLFQESNVTFCYSGKPRKPMMEKQVSLLNTSELPHQPEEQTKRIASTRVNIRTRKLREGSLNRSGAERTPAEISLGEIPRTATGKRSKTTYGGGGEKVALNRFRVWME